MIKVLGVFGALLTVLLFVSRGPQVQIRATDAGFTPQSVTIAAGEVAVFVNKGTEAIWPESEVFHARRPVPPGTRWPFEVGKSGTWKFHDRLHPAREGAVVVRGGGSVVPGVPTDPSSGNKLIKAIVSEPTRERRYALARELAFAVGSREAIRLLDETHPPHSGEMHLLGHVVGEVAYELYGEKSLPECGGDELNGCVHGIFMSVMEDRGAGGIREVVEGCRGSVPPSDYPIWCLHGAGHALLALSEYRDLHGSLKQCDELAGGNVRLAENCYYGVFMENIFGQHDGLVPRTHPWLSAEDPLRPCDAVSSQYRKVCYWNQPGWWVELFGGLPKTAAYCDKVPDAYREDCVAGVGLMIHAMNKTAEPEQVRDDCKKYFGDPATSDACLTAISRARLPNRDEAMSVGLCRAAETTPGRKRCYESLVKIIRDYEFPAVRAKSICDRFEPAYRGLCAQ